MKFRVEQDSIGKKQIPADRYYGVQTQRAIENFKITGIPMSSRPKLIRALAAVKKATAIANFELGLMEKKTADSIICASDEVFNGKLIDEFPVDMIQGGAGTSANMNANEVICNRALEIAGHKKGEYQYIHPLNHVNLSQSTNDVYPTAAKIAVSWMSDNIIESINVLCEAFFAKAKEFKNIVKMGRTQLQDAVPMTLGQEFHAFGVAIKEELKPLKEALQLCYKINMGATAIGTGINTPPQYAKKVCIHLAKITKLPLSLANDLIESTSDPSAFVAISSILKKIAIKLTKICNDLRLLSSGPQTGFHEIILPAVQPGSSIMPAKINPVIPEVVNQVCFQIMGADLTITMAAFSGQMQLNAFEPVMIYNLFDAITLLRHACFTLKEKCIDGIKANVEQCESEVRNSIGLITAFTPYIGYDESAKLAKLAQKTHKSIYELITESKLLTPQEIATILSPANMTNPNLKINTHGRSKNSKTKKRKA
jgi:aspartate ammonia-lyase